MSKQLSPWASSNGLVASELHNYNNNYAIYEYNYVEIINFCAFDANKSPYTRLPARTETNGFPVRLLQAAATRCGL